MELQNITLWLSSKKAVLVKVKTSARKTLVLDIKDDMLYLAVAAPPEDGKANVEIEKFLSKLSGRKAIIKHGHTAKEKLVQFS